MKKARVPPETWIWEQLAAGFTVTQLTEAMGVSRRWFARWVARSEVRRARYTALRKTLSKRRARRRWADHKRGWRKRVRMGLAGTAQTPGFPQ